MRGTTVGSGLGLIVAATSLTCTPSPTRPTAPAAVSCAYVVTPTAAGYPASGGSTPIVVAAPSACRWTFQGNAPWITVLADADGASNGSGNGKVILQVAANTGPRRTGTATVAYQVVQVDQAGSNGSSCTFSVSPSSAQIDAAGGSGEFTVNASAQDCGWSVDANAGTEDWISGFVTLHAVGTKTLRYSVRACSAPGRPACPVTGTIEVRDTASQRAAVFTISQR